MLRASVLALGLLIGTPALAERPRDCTTQDRTSLAQGSFYNVLEASDHRQFTLPTLTYPFDQGPAAWNLFIDLILDEAGHVVCIDLTNWQSEMPEMTAQRLAVLNRISDWTYTPFENDGKPAAALVTEFLREEEQPGPHVDMPKGDASAAVITLHRGACEGSCPAYTLSITGDGRVEFQDEVWVDIAGTHSYAIAPEAAAALFQSVRDQDIWSMRNVYEGTKLDFPVTTLSVDVGGESKVIIDDSGDSVGMPKAVSDLEDAVDKAANSDIFIYVQAASFPYLEAEHFDFAGQAGADLLASALSRDDVKDEDALIRLVDLGAPLIGGQQSGWDEDAPPVPLVSRAIANQLDRLVDVLIAHDALTPGGRRDQALIDDAFVAAVASGRMHAITTLWPFAPAVTVKAEPREGNAAPVAEFPVCLEMTFDTQAPDWNGLAVLDFLFSHGGCDLTSRDALGQTILHVASHVWQPDLVRSLIARGADLNARDSFGGSPIVTAFDEDTVMVLLESGADPTIEDKFGRSALVNVSNMHMTRAAAWLTAHGYVLPPETD